MVEHLKKQYRETPVGIGMSARGSIVELYVSDSGTWTLVLTGVDGMSCLIDAGDNWESIGLVRFRAT